MSKRTPPADHCGDRFHLANQLVAILAGSSAKADFDEVDVTFYRDEVLMVIKALRHSEPTMTREMAEDLTRRAM